MPFSDRPLMLESLETRTMLSTSVANGAVFAQFDPGLTPFVNQGAVQVQGPGPRFGVSGGNPAGHAFLDGLAADERALHDALSAIAAQFLSAESSTAAAQVASTAAAAVASQSASSAAAAPAAASSAVSQQNTPAPWDSIRESHSTATPAASDSIVAELGRTPLTSAATGGTTTSIRTLDRAATLAPAINLADSAALSNASRASLLPLAAGSVSTWPAVPPSIQIFSSLPITGQSAEASHDSSEMGRLSSPAQFHASSAKQQDKSTAASVATPLAVAHSGLASLFDPLTAQKERKVTSGWQIAAVVSAAGAMLVGRWRLAHSGKGRGRATPFSSAQRIDNDWDIE